jgi:hypothetical protein
MRRRTRLQKLPEVVVMVVIVILVPKNIEDGLCFVLVAGAGRKRG